MKWYMHVAYFFGGAFLVNAIPHFVAGVTGHPFPSPFSSPPGQGMSSATVNVWWGSFNFLVAYLLIGRVGKFDLRQTKHVLHVGVGGLERRPSESREWPTPQRRRGPTDNGDSQ